MHACLGDYTTDNRGDVGCWVREAAMGVLAALVQLVSCKLEALGRTAELQGEWGAAPTLPLPTLPLHQQPALILTRGNARCAHQPRLP